MVLASNEWLNFCEDDQKSANTTTATTATTTTTTTTITNIADNTTAASGAASPTTNTETAATTSTAAAATTNSVPAATTTIIAHTNAVDNANKEETAEVQRHKQQQKQSKPPPPKYEEVLLYNSNNLKIMSENTNAAIKNEIESAVEPASLEIDNNNRTLLLHTNFLNDTLSDTSATITNVALNLNSNVNTANSNTNTLQAPTNTVILRSGKGVNSGSVNAPQAPITPQALSSALQSVMSAAAAANNGANAGTALGNLQNSFLSSLGIGVAANAALQQTAKQLSSTFCVPAALESQTNLTTVSNSSTSGLGSISGTQLDNSDGELGNGLAKILLLCESNSHPFQTRNIQLTPNIECKVGRLIAKSKASESNAIFDCKVLSRNHAVLWYSDDGKFWVKDTKSSNGTFINENKLGNEAAELHFGDIVKFGVDVLENSRKEVHGCIIAFVKLYLPDGREAISIDATAPRSQFSGDGNISYDELHRLNSYMQEASQREKVLKSKLFNLQNLLDATRKNSALCWQSMIAEDQLLHRIHSLEKKLQLMEKNVPESVLRNEVLKLLDDKNSYQHTAKEALRKVYQERCDTMQKLSKMESAYAGSDNECKILREQIMNTKQTLQDVNARLLCLETEYNEYRAQTDQQQQEAKEQEQQRIAELNDKLRHYELECEELRRKVAELMHKRAKQLDEDEQQAIEKLDAAIADMDLGDGDEDDDDDDDGNNNDDDDHVGDDVDNEAQNVADHEAPGDRTAAKKRSKRAKAKKRAELSGSSVPDTSSSSCGSEKKSSICAAKPAAKQASPKETKHKVAKESTIMKWLQNSDLNKTAGSLDIFKAICNESDSSEERDAELPVGDGETGAGTKRGRKASANASSSSSVEDFERKCAKFTSKLQNVQRNLKQLEAEIVSDTNQAENVIAAMDDGSAVLYNDSDEEGDDERDQDEVSNEFILKRNGTAPSKDKKRYMLLKRSVCMLREAYNEICDNMKPQLKQKSPRSAKEATPSPAISVQTQFQNYAMSDIASKKYETQETFKTLPEANEQHESDEEEEDEDDISDATTSRLSICSLQTIKEVDVDMQMHSGGVSPTVEGQDILQLDRKMLDYEQQIAELSSKLEQNENDAQSTLEIMQIECDAFKDKVYEQTKLISVLREEKQALEQLMMQHKLTTTPVVETQQEPVSAAPLNNSTQNELVFEHQMREELVVINSNAVQREEELIVYKERLDQTQQDNLQLRNEIAQLKLKTDDYKLTLLRRLLPYGAVLVAILVYFLLNYF